MTITMAMFFGDNDGKIGQRQRREIIAIQGGVG